MLCRGLRQAAANAKQLSLIEQRLLAAGCSGISQFERFPTDLYKAIAQQVVARSAHSCQGLHTFTARSVSLWSSSPTASSPSHTQLRDLSSKSDTADAAEAETAEAAASAADEQAEAEEQPIDPKDQLLAEKEQQVITLRQVQSILCAGWQAILICLPQVADYKDKLVHVLADMENLRQRTNRQAEQSRTFAIQVNKLLQYMASFAQSCKAAAWLYTWCKCWSTVIQATEDAINVEAQCRALSKVC